MASLADIRGLGYEVEDANGGYVISGFGVVSYFTEADLATFGDPTAHADRVKQFDNPPPAPKPTATPLPLAQAITALQTLDQSKPATIGDVVAVLKTVLGAG